ncbi:MAG: MTH938/NDUFAF3 family protein [Candidatus Thermoplasmatota archaeon]
MIIERTSFGKVVIDGKSYGDVLIVEGKILERDWERGSHRVSKGEVKKLLSGKPDIVIIATGQDGVLDANDVIAEIGKSAELVILETPEAIKKFNELSKSKKVNALIHTTC